MFVVTGNGLLIFDSKSGTLADSKVGVHKKNVYTVDVGRDLIATGG